MTYLSQLMPNPYVVICASPWLCDSVGNSSLNGFNQFQNKAAGVEWILSDCFVQKKATGSRTNCKIMINVMRFKGQMNSDSQKSPLHFIGLLLHFLVLTISRQSSLVNSTGFRSFLIIDGVFQKLTDVVTTLFVAWHNHPVPDTSFDFLLST